VRRLESWFREAIVEMRAIGAALVAILVVLVLALAKPSAAQEEPSGTSYITPFPEGDVYKLQAYGDGFAEGLLNGLVEAFAGDGRVQVSRKHRPLFGLTRPEFDDEMKAEEAPGRESFHIGVVMIGLGDRNHIRTSPRDRALLGSDEWRNEYGRRVDRFIKTLKKRGVAVYWVGQPVMRRPDVNEPAQAMNDIAREKAYLNGAKFIDIQAHFADDGGNYAPYGPDITGKQRLLREVDGVLFTYFGYRKLAHFVEQEIKRDLLQAKNERAIPLAGGEAEQKRVNSLKPRASSPGEGTWKGTVTKDGKAVQQKSPAQIREAPVADSSNDQRADNGRITLKSLGAGGREESVTIDILRPAIPSAVIALMTRKDTGDRPSQMGDVVADEVGGGLVALSSITPAGVGPGTNRRVAAPSLSPYYTVLIKGERPTPKPGRADDFSWPRVDPQIVVEPPAPTRRPPRSSSPKAGSPRS
jgi:uncharacterized protein